MPYSTRPLRIGAHTVALSLALALLLGACGGGSKHKTQSVTVTTAPKVLAVKTSVLKIGTVDIHSAGPTNPIDTTTGKAVLGATQAYLDDAVFGPLKAGQIGQSYPTLFDPAIRATATGADQSALTELVVGKVSNLTTTAKPVYLSALEGPLGELMYVATDVDLTIRAKSGTTAVAIQRHVELTFVKNGATWQVTAYRVQAVRKTAAGTTTTTATRGTTP